MKIVFDCGGSTGRWALFDGEGHRQGGGRLPQGFNARWHDGPYFRQFLNALLEGLEPPTAKAVKEVRFYSAGIDDERPPDFIAEELRRRFPRAEAVVVASDLVGVAHTFLQDKEGIVGIVGTGSVAGYYRPPRMEAWMRSLGFLYGDEGSGVCIARRVLQHMAAERLPPEAEAAVCGFLGVRPGDYRGLVEVLYHSPGPGQWLGKLVEAMHPFYGAEWWRGLVRESFDAYVRFKVEPLLERFAVDRIVITGGVASAFADLLREAFVRRGLPSPLIFRGFLSLGRQSES